MVKRIKKQANYLNNLKKMAAVCLLLQSATAFAEPVQVHVDRDTVAINQSFQITFIAADDLDSSPDFSTLEKEFDIIDRNRTSNVSWVNGVSSATTQWTFDVMAKHAGKIVIPPLHFGKELSPALTVTVTEEAQQAQVANTAADLFLDVEATPTKAFVQSQILFTLRFYRRVNITEASLKDPELPDAVVSKLGEDLSYKRQLKGIDYAITERHYAIFPQKSGTLTIPSLVLTAAVVADDQAGVGGFFGTRTTRTERVSSKPLTLTVFPAPAAFKGHWLAAEQLELKQQWSADVQQVKVGEPLTRTLTLRATGTTVGQLPSLHTAENQADLKNYPDQPRLEEQKTDNGLIALREEKIAFIPTKTGRYTLPAIEIPWFNVKTQKIERAMVEATTITVAAGNHAPTVPSAPVDKVGEKSVDNSNKIHNLTLNSPRQPVITPPNQPLWQGLAAFFALGWVVTLFFLLRKKSDAPLEASKAIQAHHANRKAHYLMLKQACKANQAQAVKEALLAYGKHEYQATSLGRLADFCTPALQAQILTLNQILYGQKTATFQGEPLWQAFNQQFKTAKPKTAVEDPLEPLHRL
jgi:hypothetical protein